MAIEQVLKDLGAATAYAYAVEKGYTGTEEEFAELMASYASVAQSAATSATAAAGSATSAASSASTASAAATTATTKASEASTSATNAAGSASSAASSATAASGSATSAAASATTASGKASEATTAAATATSAKTDAVAANTAAQSAKTAAQTAQTGAETAAASVQSSAAQIATNTEDITQLKDDLSEISEETRNMFSGEIGTINGMAWDNGTLTNTRTDGRTQFYCIIRFKNDTSIIIASTVKVISASARYAITLTPTSDGNNIQIVHNGSITNLTASLLCDFEANKTYTVSFNVDEFNPSSVGGLKISKIQIELGDTATAYIGHTTAYDDVARGGNEQNTNKFNAISAHSPNLFNGTFSTFSNMEENDGKIENTNTDTRDGFYFTVRYLNGSAIINSSATIPINFYGRVAQALTATADCTAIQIVHNGRQQNLSFTMPFTVQTGETYTVSLDVEGYDVTVVGGLILSNIQIELGDKDTAYIPSEYTAVDYIARNAINARTPEAKLNVLLMGDSIFGNDGEIALFLDQMCNSCVNGAFGGTRVSVRPYTSDAFRFFDGVNIITALCTQTWTDQDASAESLATSYPWITARLAGLKTVDISKIDLLVMDWGTNDYTAGATIEDITTAYNTVIDMLQTTYPELRILITTPIWRYWGTESDNENGDNKVYNVSTLKEIALAIEDFMKNKRISVLNAYQNLPLSYKTALTYFDANDKTHLNTFGNKVYAYLLHGKIRSIY